MKYLVTALTFAALNAPLAHAGDLYTSQPDRTSATHIATVQRQVSGAPLALGKTGTRNRPILAPFGIAEIDLNGDNHITFDELYRIDSPALRSRQGG